MRKEIKYMEGQMGEGRMILGIGKIQRKSLVQKEKGQIYKM